MAQCLSSAFSAGLWAQTPMPVGNAGDPASALGIIARLGRRPVVVAASPELGGRVIGCVLGCVMEPSVIEAYGLTDFDARPGDGLLAFIGIVPEAQGLSHQAACGPGRSLARQLFAAWLEAPALRECPRLFIRTRRQIGAIRYLNREYGFELCGGFKIEFRGERQSRLVYRRIQRPAEAL